MICTSQNLQAQTPLHSWRDHYSFKDGKSVCYSNDKIYCATIAGIFTLKPSTGEIDKLTKTNGISDVNISAIAYIDKLQLIAVGYENGNIDLVFPNQIVNIADIMNQIILGSKSINNFLYHNNYLYISTGFGIVVLNIAKEEISDTYYIGALGAKVEVNKLDVFDGRFYAATKKGLFSADISSQTLYNYESWTLESKFRNSEIRTLASTPSALYIADSKGEETNDTLWKYNGTHYTALNYPSTKIHNLNYSNNKLLLSTRNALVVCNAEGATLETITQCANGIAITPKAALFTDPQHIAIADGEQGLVYGTPQSLYPVQPNGIVKNTSFAMAVSAEQVVSLPGAYRAAFSNSWTPFYVDVFENNRWNYHANFNVHDAVVATFNPRNSTECYVGSWGGGVFQMNGTKVEKHYTPSNSSLQPISSENQSCRISGLCFDSQQNLWVSNPLASRPISVMKPNGEWVSFNYATLINTDKVSTLHCAPNDVLWLLMPREALFALHPGSNIDSQSDDKYKRFRPSGPDGTVYSVDYNAMAFDLDGYLWLGTSQGVLVCYNPSNVFTSNPVFQRIKLPDIVEGLAVYLLEKESITAITIDGGNRKWIGTAKSGAFLFSKDGTKEIYHFDTKNSPLPSDNILDIKIHPSTGEVFFGTEKGLVSFRGESTSPSTAYGKVYAFPNPVHPDFTGDIAIVGLVDNTTVKITDISGNLVYETQSLGGSATWNGKTMNGKKAATGVYLVFLSNADGSQKAVTKILFVN